MMIIPAVLQLEGQMQSWRRHLHAHPELGFEEQETAAFIAGKLRDFGVEVTERVGETGVVGTLRSTLGDGPAIGLRADMDALPITEGRSLPHGSRFSGRMHACGHDGHMATLLGAAAALARAPEFAGTVHFIFQPAEEGLGGALAMLRDGLFERFPCDEIYAFHNCERPLGQILVHEKAVAAGADRFVIRLKGLGGHAATPHLARSPLPVAARVLLQIEALPGRLTDATSPAVVTVAAIHGGEAFNIIPDEVVLTGTVRCFDESVRRTIQDAIQRVAVAEAAISEISAHIQHETLFAPTINTPEKSRFLAGIAAEIAGSDNVVVNPAPEMGSEDFSFMLQERPGCYFLIGQGDDDHRAVCHHPEFDFNDRILAVGASIWVRLIQRRLAQDFSS